MNDDHDLSAIDRTMLTGKEGCRGVLVGSWSGDGQPRGWPQGCDRPTLLARRTCPGGCPMMRSTTPLLATWDDIESQSKITMRGRTGCPLPRRSVAFRALLKQRSHGYCAELRTGGDGAVERAHAEGNRPLAEKKRREGALDVPTRHGGTPWRAPAVREGDSVQLFYHAKISLEDIVGPASTAAKSPIRLN